jgi:hypothetical protein
MTRSKRLWACAVLLMAAVLASGCSTFRGAPKPPIERKLIESGEFVDVPTELTMLATTQNKNSRDASVRKLMALIDIRYMHFRNDIVANRRHTKSASNALLLATDIAATLTESVGVKDNYIALSALIQGGDTIYDKDYLLDRTIDALVAQMDANRKAKQVDIYRRLLEPTDQYPGQAAIADVMDYYYSGTLNGALLGVQESAQEQERRSERELLRIPTLEEIEVLRSDTRKIADFVKGIENEDDLLKLRAFLADEGVDMSEFAAAVDLKGRRIAVIHGFTALRDEKPKFQEFAKLKAALQAVGFSLQ